MRVINMGCWRHALELQVDVTHNPIAKLWDCAKCDLKSAVCVDLYIHPPLTLKKPNPSYGNCAYRYPRVTELIATNPLGSNFLKYAEADAAERQKMWEPTFSNVYDVTASICSKACTTIIMVKVNHTRNTILVIVQALYRMNTVTWYTLLNRGSHNFWRSAASASAHFRKFGLSRLVAMSSVILR